MNRSEVAAVRARQTAGPVLTALAALVAAALVGAALLTPRPWALQVGASGDGYFISNSYPPERGEVPLRWAGAATDLRLHGAYAGPGAVELRLFRDPQATAGRPWPLELRVAGAPPARFEALPGWRRYQVVLPPGATTAPITLAGPTFQPGDNDPRGLNVALAEVRVAPHRGPAPLGAALAQAGWVAALLALIGAACWLLDAWSLGHAAGRPLRIAALTGALGAAAAVWAWLGPASFAWALAPNWPAAGAGAALAGAGALALRGRARAATSRQADRQTAVFAALAALGLAHAALFPALPALWRQAGAIGILLAPGALAALALLWDEADPAERAFLGIAGGLGVAALLMLGLHALPGAPPWWAPVAAADALSALGLYTLWTKRGAPAPAHTPRPHRWLALPLLLGAALRLWGLGTSQFQGDEAYAMLLAKGVAYGQEEILLVHMKGPVEALLPAGALVVAGSIAELTARLPFALAGVGLILAAWCLAGRLIGGRAGDVAGFCAALAVAADGLLLAFGRIVQYQMLVALLAAAALWLSWRFFAGAPARRTLPAAALAAAVSVLAHYDGIYVAPALAWLVVAGGLRRGWRPRQWAAGLGATVAIGLGATLSFYGPFVLHEHFANTLSHLETRSGQGTGGAQLYNNLPGYAGLLSVYATPYVAAFAGLALLGALMALLVHVVRPRWLGAGLAALLGFGSLAALLAPGALELRTNLSLAVALAGPPLAALALAPRLPAGLRALVLWAGASLVAHAFLIADPRTHFNTAHLPGWLLVGWAVAGLWEGARRPAGLRPAVAAAGAAALTLGLAYSAMVVLRPWPEYERAYPATLLPFYTPPTGETLPDDGLFAFPARDGWKAAAAMFASGELRGTFDTNQKIFTAGWYLRGQFRCQAAPDYFLAATGARPLWIPAGYHLAAAVRVEGVEALRVYSREPVAGPPREVDAADYAAAYDAAAVGNFPLRELVSGVVPQVALGTRWRDGFALRGYDLDRTTLEAGEVAFLTLYWRADQPLPASLAPVVQIRDGAGKVVGEGEPFCSGMPADAWQRTYVNDTPFRLMADGLPPGDYTLHVGVRDSQTGAWAPVGVGGELLELTRITVR
jgi:hypothetical protein